MRRFDSDLLEQGAWLVHGRRLLAESGTLCGMVMSDAAGGDGVRTPKQVWAEWMAANEQGDADRAGLLAAEMTRVAPGSFFAWYEAGLHAKARRDWSQSATWNERAMALFGEEVATEFGGDNPAAWNLGIAATATGDWATARRAWTAYGIDGLADDPGPIDVNFGQVPIRLNPDRPSLSLQVVPQFGTTEVVWCWRRSPAHAVIASVPLPESGHRFRDVLLHDGEPRGSRRIGDRDVSVFDELEKLHDSGLPTWQAQVEGTTPEDAEALGDIAGPRDLGVDDWSGIRVMCSDCSHGTPDPGHLHPPASRGAAAFGLAGHEEDVRACLDEWLRLRPHLHLLDLQFLW